MVDELDMSVELKWFHEERAGMVVKNLRRRAINAQYVPTRAEALSTVMAMIPEGAKVVRGDSLTVDEVGIIPALNQRNKNVLIDPFERQPDGRYVIEEVEKRSDVQREAFFADVFLAGSNAVTMDGKLVNTDGKGNRVAPMIFGPKKVILVVGVNKIVKDVDEAMERIHTICAPINAKRHALKHHRPDLEELACVRTGRCIDCSHESRICRITTIIEGCLVSSKGRINVVLVGENLGI